MITRTQNQSQAKAKSSVLPPVNRLVQRMFAYQRGFSPVDEWEPEQSFILKKEEKDCFLNCEFMQIIIEFIKEGN